MRIKEKIKFRCGRMEYVYSKPVGSVRRAPRDFLQAKREEAARRKAQKVFRPTVFISFLRELLKE